MNSEELLKMGNELAETLCRGFNLPPEKFDNLRNCYAFVQGLLRSRGMAAVIDAASSLGVTHLGLGFWLTEANQIISQ